MEILWQTLILYSAQLLLIVPALIYSGISIYRVCTDGCLHFAFRACLAIICSRVFPHSVQFAAEAIGIFAIYGSYKQLPYTKFLEALEILEVYGTACTQLALSVERIVAIIDPKYEKRFDQMWKKVIFSLLTYTPGLFMSVQFTFQDYHSTGKTARFMLLAAYLISFSTMLATFRSSLKNRGKRHDLRLKLAQRYSTKENLKASVLYLPILVNELLCEIVKTCLVYFTRPSRIQENGLAVITAFQCLFFSSFLFYQHRRLANKSSELAIFASPQATENYFSSYDSAWRRIQK